MNYQEALKYVKNAMENLDFIQDIRYMAFPVGDYCVCGGIACISAKLADRLRASSIGFLSKYSDAADYLRDCKGRNLACFIGIAIPKSEIKMGMIPDIPLEQYWEIYLEYLKHQWLSEISTHSEQLDMPPIDIKEKRYVKYFIPKIEKYGARNIVRDYALHEQQTLDYFFNLILTGSDDSLITEIHGRSEWEKLNFKTAAVSESLYQAIKTKPAISNRPDSENTMQDGKVYLKYGPDLEEPGYGSADSKKNSRISKSGLTLVIGAVVLLVILLLILKR